MAWKALAQSSPIGPLTAMCLAEESGPPILFLHGVTRHARDWMGIAGSLSHRWQPICLDFRGHGDSARVPDGYRVANYVDDAVHIARTYIDRPFIIFGHSLGAMVALAVAYRLKDQVVAAILEDPPFETLGTGIHHTPYHSQFVSIQKLLLEESWHGTAGLAQKLGAVTIDDPTSGAQFQLRDRRDQASLRFNAATLAKMDPAALTPVVEGIWLQGFPWQRFLPTIECPLLLLQADAAAGGMLTDNDAEAICQNAPDVVHVRFPGVGHQIHGLQPEALLRVAVPFLESLPIENPY